MRCSLATVFPLHQHQSMYQLIEFTFFRLQGMKGSFFSSADSSCFVLNVTIMCESAQHHATPRAAKDKLNLCDCRYCHPEAWYRCRGQREWRRTQRRITSPHNCTQHTTPRAANVETNRTVFQPCSSNSLSYGRFCRTSR